MLIPWVFLWLWVIIPSQPLLVPYQKTDRGGPCDPGGSRDSVSQRCRHSVNRGRGIRSHGIGRSFIGDDGRNSSLVALSPRFPAELQADRNEGSIIRIALGVIVHPQLDRE